MKAIDPVIYFESKASNIVCKYTNLSNITVKSNNSAVGGYQAKLQKLEEELDAELSSILSDYTQSNCGNLEALITSLYFCREKARYEFSKKNKF